jgi:LytS/YehU family sensor histidine kinase
VFWLTNIFVIVGVGFVSAVAKSVLKLCRRSQKRPPLNKFQSMLFRHKGLFWLSLTLLLFGFFRWLFGLALPGAALEFALGTTLILSSALFLGNIVTKLAIRTNTIRNVPKTISLTIAFVLVGFVCIAFLLNAMIEKTTLFPFAVTVMLLFLVTAAAGSLATIIRHQYKTKILSAQAATAQSKSELQLLQSQLSPHFLFNTLNNLYGLSMSEPHRLPPLLLKLSELLRYSVYDVKEIFVPLHHEVDYIRNYIEFERLRLGERLKLDVEFEAPADAACTIPPLMLIVFVENAFKHSRTTGNDAISIELKLRKRENQIVFFIRNSTAVKARNEQHPDKHSGFGLDSVRKRLNLLYAGKHTLKIEKTETDHSVYLELQCQ